MVGENEDGIPKDAREFKVSDDTDEVTELYHSDTEPRTHRTSMVPDAPNSISYPKPPDMVILDNQKLVHGRGAVPKNLDKDLGLIKEKPSEEK